MVVSSGCHFNRGARATHRRHVVLVGCVQPVEQLVVGCVQLVNAVDGRALLRWERRRRRVEPQRVLRLLRLWAKREQRHHRLAHLIAGDCRVIVGQERQHNQDVGLGVLCSVGRGVAGAKRHCHAQRLAAARIDDVVDAVTTAEAVHRKAARQQASQGQQVGALLVADVAAPLQLQLREAHRRVCDEA